MAFATYKIRVRPGVLRSPEQFAPGTTLRIVDPATWARLPQEGAVVSVRTREHEIYWDRNEKSGDVDVTLHVEGEDE